MKIKIAILDKEFTADLAYPNPIGITLSQGENPGCYYTPPPEIAPVRDEGFIGSLKEGGPVNHMTISLAPHGNGTHTECSGHIFDNNLTIDRVLKENHFPAQLISLKPEEMGAATMAITAEQIEAISFEPGVSALIIRSLPNSVEKQTKNYSGTNPPFITKDAMLRLVEGKIDHLIVDLPSVDPEVDGGKLVAHKTFWSDEYRRKHCTITELAYIPDSIPDGFYLLNLQALRIELDASPANPVLYALKTI